MSHRGAGGAEVGTKASARTVRVNTQDACADGGVFSFQPLTAGAAVVVRRAREASARQPTGGAAGTNEGYGG